MQSVSSRIWTRVTVFISYDDNNYTTVTSKNIMTAGRWLSWSIQIPLWWKLDLLLWPRDQETEFPVEEYWLSQTQEGQTEQIHPQNFDSPFFDNTGMIYMHWVPTRQTVNEEYYVEVLREFRKRLHRKMPALFKSDQ